MTLTLRAALLAIFIALPLQAINAVADDGWYSNMDEVPEAVQAAATKAKPGIILKKSKLTWRTDEGVYIVVGMYFGKAWRFNITSSGQVLSMVELD